MEMPWRSCRYFLLNLYTAALPVLHTGDCEITVQLNGKVETKVASMKAIGL
jgi:hypothetical protein